jgi:hypothetical protein
MASTREQVVQAVFALVQGALPFADVARNRDKPNSIGPGGQVIVRDGDPGPPEIDLSPLSYNYEHRITVEIAAPSDSRPREEALDDMLAPIGAAIAADRFLGGLCTFLDVEAPAPDDLDAPGARTTSWADLTIVASYATPGPLS